MTTTDNEGNLYEVIIIESGKDYAVLCPGIPGAVSQGTDREDALKMIADVMAMAQMYPLPGDDNEARRAELRELGSVRIKGLVEECRLEGLKFEVHEVTPRLISPPVSIA